MKALNKRTGQLEKLYVKALDSMPVGTIVEFNGQASDIPSGWEEVDNVLWENPDTTTAWDSTQTITLDSDDYNYLLIGYYPHITRDRIIRTVVVPKGYSFKIASSEGSTFSERTFTRISDISFSIPTTQYFGTFGSTTPTSTSYNTIIPVFIMKI